MIHNDVNNVLYTMLVNSVNVIGADINCILLWKVTLELNLYTFLQTQNDFTPQKMSEICIYSINSTRLLLINTVTLTQYHLK